MIVLNNFFIISPRGDTVIAKSYRTSDDVGAHERSHTEAFFRKIKFWDGIATPGIADSTGLTPAGVTSGGGDAASGADGGSGSAALDGAAGSNGSSGGGESTERKGDAPPVFIMPDGLSYIHVKRNGLIFGCSTNRNVSPCTVVELLSKIAKVFKDYCGTLSEEAIRKNFILLYELLDEMLDYGYPQVTSTENLKSFVYNEPIVVTPVVNTGQMVNPKTASASAVHKPVINSVNASGKKTNSTNQKNEIFVDILERLNVLFSNNGYVLNSTIDGCIQMKSYLAGNPELRLALNEDLVVGREKSSAAPYGAVVLDDINFHESVNLNEFEYAKTLQFRPPDGEFVVLNYRLTGDFKTPFRIFPAIEETAPKTMEISVLVRAEMPENHFGANVSLELPLPKCTAAASCSLVTSPGTTGAHAEYSAQDRKVLWTMKKLPGNTEQTMRIKVTLNQPCTSSIRREIGPIGMNFEIPMYNVSNLQIKYLRIAENMPGYTPYRW
eukprot:CAMPEP_0181033342 /NCGR_PEP_ID=MMETSP1070-20121207/7205_1 /TAXON_ID=265543 /ORGANISM="Minutocellus polymorphus, Strain NH13" /LENGTH=495 /DNA_ID=CAMNT_0023110761 /DNA_START=77 /DNA_END=1561 /DNA_ORIENTATION=+